MKLTVLINIVLSVVILSISAPALANPCNITMNQIITFGTGKVRLNYEFTESSSIGYSDACDLDEEYNGVSPTTCAIWTATAQRALKDNTSLEISFDTSGSSSCNNQSIINHTPIYYLLASQGSGTGGTPPPSSNQLLNESNLSVNTTGGVLNYSFNVPSGAATLNVDLTNVTGDPDLYVQYGNAPTTSDWTCRPYESVNTDELCSINNPQAGTWYVMILADDPFSGANLNASTQ